MAFVELESEEKAKEAIVKLHDSLFKGKQLVVIKKRLNLPGKKRNKKSFYKQNNQYAVQPPFLPMPFNPMGMQFMNQAMMNMARGGGGFRGRYMGRGRGRGRYRR